MVFCLPAWVIRVVSHNPEHIAALPGSPLFWDGGRMGLVLGTTVLPHQDDTHLVLLCHPGGIQKPFQEDNQCRFLFPADPAKKKASFRVVLAPPLRLAQLLTAFSPEWQLHCKYRTLLSLYKKLVYFSNWLFLSILWVKFISELSSRIKKPWLSTEKWRASQWSPASTTAPHSQQQPYNLAVLLPTNRRKDSKSWASFKLQKYLSSPCKVSLCRDINCCLSSSQRVDRSQVSWYPYEYIIFEISPSKMKLLDVCWGGKTNRLKD